MDYEMVTILGVRIFVDVFYQPLGSVFKSEVVVAVLLFAIVTGGEPNVLRELVEKKIDQAYWEVRNAYTSMCLRKGGLAVYPR